MSGPNEQSQVAVIGPQFCTGYAVDLTIVPKMKILSPGNFGVTDVNGNLMFTVKGMFFSFPGRRVLLDAAGNPIITFQRNPLSAHGRWVAFRGESTDAKDEVFSVRKSSRFQRKTKLDVFLASNTTEQACEFNIEGGSSCVIYAGHSDHNNIIAKMHQNHSVQSFLLGKDSFGVTVGVYPNVDCAFVVALVVILKEFNYNMQNS